MNNFIHLDFKEKFGRYKMEEYLLACSFLENNFGGVSEVFSNRTIEKDVSECTTACYSKDGNVAIRRTNFSYPISKFNNAEFMSDEVTFYSENKEFLENLLDDFNKSYLGD